MPIATEKIVLMTCDLHYVLFNFDHVGDLAGQRSRSFFAVKHFKNYLSKEAYIKKI
jgi:hypothetical protein